MARTLQPTSLAFKVHRSEPELVAPIKPTPREYKSLSDIDDRYGHQFQHPIILLYQYNPSMEGKDPAKVIRDAIAKTLVFYYPFAGRLKEGPNGKLSVDCTGEGVLFIEGDADVTLQQFGDNPLPPFPCMDELLFDVKGYGGILNCPLFLIQVTRLKCGGFIFTIRHNRTMADATGLLQFMKAVGEMARGALTPTISPVWERHLLNARTPPQVTYAHPECDQKFMDMNDNEITQLNNMVNLSFFFGTNEISTLRKLIPPHYQCTTHEILTSCLWRCHTKALQLDPDQHIRLICIVNARSKFNPPLPLGYYGNAIAYPMTVITAGKLCQSPLEYAIELVKQVKGKATEEYMKFTADFLVTSGRRGLTLNRWCFLVSNLTRIKFQDVDFGWGKAVYGGDASNTFGKHFIPFTNDKGEDGIVVPLYLPALIMERFVNELNSLLKNENPDGNHNCIKSNM